MSFNLNQSKSPPLGSPLADHWKKEISKKENGSSGSDNSAPPTTKKKSHCCYINNNNKAFPIINKQNPLCLTKIKKIGKWINNQWKEEKTPFPILHREGKN